MLSIDDALRLILSRTTSLGEETVPRDLALGRVLAAEIASDIDSPPHDKSIVDGYAVLASDVTPSCELELLEEVTAGCVPTKTVARGTCTRIMTGAPIPAGADAVVMIEETEQIGSRIVFRTPRCEPGRNIMRRATSLAAGQIVLEPRRRLRAVELGLAAEVGCETLRVFRRPQVAFLATGNELTPPHIKPPAGCIRNSNGPLLAGMIAQAQSEAIDLGIARDERDELRAACEIGLRSDVLILSGGVSAGVLDLVPSVLESLGTQCVFHKVNLKPGKPLWFGVKEHGSNRSPTLVFGLPGNPVSTLVCFETFVRPALAKLAGDESGGLKSLPARLVSEFRQRGDRFTLYPGRTEIAAGELRVRTLAWRGSGDLRTLTEADCLIEFPPGERTFEAGANVIVRMLPSS